MPALSREDYSPAGHLDQPPLNTNLQLVVPSSRTSVSASDSEKCNVPDLNCTLIFLVSVSEKNRNDNLESDALSVFACTKGGFVIEVNFQKVTIRSVHRLYPAHASSEQKPDSPKKGKLLFRQFCD